MNLQPNYNTSPAALVLGQVGNMELTNIISRLVEDAGGLEFGRLVMQGTADAQVKKATALSVAVGSPVTTGTGNGSIGTPTVDAGAQPGDYKVVIIEPGANVGTFEVFKPDGSLDGTGVVAVAYNGSINFTLADGATDFLAGDYITVPVTQTGASKIVGVSRRDDTLAPSASAQDVYPVKATAGIVTKGTVAVTCGATVAARDPVYYIPSSGKFTNVPGTSNVLVPGALFETASTDAALVLIRLNLT
jgi:hypothetical protein